MNRFVSFTLIVALLIVFSIVSVGCKKDTDDESRVTTTSPLPEEKAKSVEKSGDFSFSLFSSYARVDSYSGDGGIVDIPDSIYGLAVKSVGENAFFGNNSIIKIMLPKSVVEIDTSAFENCSNLDEIDLSNVFSIGLKAFQNSGLKNVKLSPKLQNLGKSAFAGTKLEEISIPASVILTTDYIVSGCAELKKIELPFTIKKIGTRMAYNCKSLEAVEIPDSVKEISDYAFSSCPSLKTVVIPKSVEKIGNNIVYNSPNAKIILEKGSYAEEYCKTHNIDYLYGKD